MILSPYSKSAYFPTIFKTYKLNDIKARVYSQLTIKEFNVGFHFFSWLELVLCCVQYGHEKDWDSRGLSECVYTKMANTFSKPIIELSILSISVYHYLFVWHLLRRRIEFSWHISIHVYWRRKKKCFTFIGQGREFGKNLFFENLLCSTAENFSNTKENFRIRQKFFLVCGTWNYLLIIKHKRPLKQSAVNILISQKFLTVYLI